MRRISILLALVPAWGCGQGTSSLSYEIGRKGGSATLSMGGTTILFEGIPYEGADARSKLTGFFMTSGPGAAKGKSAVDGVTLAYEYEGGVARLSLGEYSFEVVESGTKLVFSGRTFDLGAKTIRVARDGSARIAD